MDFPKGNCILFIVLFINFIVYMWYAWWGRFHNHDMSQTDMFYVDNGNNNASALITKDMLQIYHTR